MHPSMYRWLARNWDSYDIVHCHQIFHWPFIVWIARAPPRAPLVVFLTTRMDPLDLRKSRLKSFIYAPA
jgi:hypothetical protein